MGWQFRLQSVWKTRLKQELQTNTTNASLKAVHQRNTQSRQLTKVELTAYSLNNLNSNERIATPQAPDLEFE